jgi:hypothetical protein
LDSTVYRLHCHHLLITCLSGNAAQGYLESALHQHLSKDEYRAALLEARIIAIDEGIIKALDKYNLDVLVLPAWTEMSIYAAWARKSPPNTSTRLHFGEGDAGEISCRQATTN